MEWPVPPCHRATLDGQSKAVGPGRALTRHDEKAARGRLRPATPPAASRAVVPNRFDPCRSSAESRRRSSRLVIPCPGRAASPDRARQAPRRRPESRPCRGAGGSGGARSGRVRTLAGSCRVMTERVGLDVDTLTIRIPMRLQRRGGRKLIMTPEGVAAPTLKPSRDETMVKALVRAHRWRRRIESGQAKSITDLAEQEGVTDAYVCRLLPLTCLAPDIVEAILDGRQPKGLRLAELLGNAPLAWEEQRACPRGRAERTARSSRPGRRTARSAGGAPPRAVPGSPAGPATAPQGQRSPSAASCDGRAGCRGPSGPAR
jgi:hypothetical protein